METTQLPTTAKLFLPAFFTVTRRPNLKSKMDEIKKKYFFDSFDEKNLKAYKELLHYKREDVPLPYLYLLAQKSQIALMLDKKFIFPLIGMVHMDNEMELLHDISFGKRIELTTTAEQFFNEEKNRIEVNFTVDFSQDGKAIAVCKSKYLALSGKRPKDSKVKNETETPQVEYTQISNDKFKVSDARTYAKVSGDYNLIHLSPLLAKLFGFKSSLLHGMYMKGLMAAHIQNHTHKKLKKIYIQFKKPLLLPNEINGFIANDESGGFKVITPKKNKEILAGKVEFF